MRTYEKTHPWLTFSVNLSAAPALFWVMLGECQSKCEHIRWAPLLPENQQRLQRLYLAKGCLATTAIEGNTLSEKEVMLHLDNKLRLPPSREYLARELDNIVSACNEIVAVAMKNPEESLTVEGIKQFNAKALQDLTLDDDIVPGQIRGHSVGVFRYKAPPAQDCDYLLGRLCDWLNSEAFNSPENTVMVHAVIKAVLAHLYLAWIHPFGDGNGRTARLVEFQILISSGVPAPAAHLLSNHYNKTRSEYYRQLDKAGHSGEVIPFLMYAVQGFLDGLKSQLEEIRDQQWDVIWRDYVWQKFREKTGPADVRRRRLVFALSRTPRRVRLSQLTDLDPHLAVAYAAKTPKTLSRDVNELVRMELVVKEGSYVRAKTESIFGFLPVGTAAQDTWMRVMGTAS